MKTRPDYDTLIFAMFLLYASRPRKREPDEIGRNFIGDVGDAPEKSWTRPLGPYGPAVKISGVKFQNGTPQIAFVNDLEEPESQPDFW